MSKKEKIYVEFSLNFKIVQTAYKSFHSLKLLILKAKYYFENSFNP